MDVKSGYKKTRENPRAFLALRGYLNNISAQSAEQGLATLQQSFYASQYGARS